MPSKKINKKLYPKGAAKRLPAILVKKSIKKSKNLFVYFLESITKRISLFLLHFTRFWQLTFKICLERDILSLAQSLSYITVLSLVPIFAVFFLVLSFFMNQDGIPIIDPNLTSEGGQRSIDLIAGVIIDFLPNYVQPFLQELLQLSDQAVRVGLIGFPALAITSLLLYLKVDTAINSLWSSFNRRGIFRNFSAFISSIILGPLLLGMLLSLPTYLRVYINISDFLPESSIWWRAASYFLPFCVSWVLFFVMYYFVPIEKVNKKSAIIGAFWGSLLIKFVNWIMGFYLTSFSQLDTLYGSLIIIPVLMIWLYAVWLLVLFCSVLVYVHQTFAHKNFVVADNLMVQYSNLGLAFKILLYLADCFKKRKPSLDLLEICYSLNSDKRQTHKMLNHLHKFGLISAVYAGSLKKHTNVKYQLACAPENIKVSEVLEMYSTKQVLPYLPKYLNEFFYYLDTSPFYRFKLLNLKVFGRLSSDLSFNLLTKDSLAYNAECYVINVEKMDLRLKIGINEWEKTVLQPVEISFKIKFDAPQESLKDDIKHTINYSELTKQIKKEFNQKSYKLLEALLDDILTKLINFKSAKSVWAKISKPYATKSAYSISIEGSREKKLSDKL